MLLDIGNDILIAALTIVIILLYIGALHRTQKWEAYAYTTVVSSMVAMDSALWKVIEATQGIESEEDLDDNYFSGMLTIYKNNVAVYFRTLNMACELYLRHEIGTKFFRTAILPYVLDVACHSIEHKDVVGVWGMSPLDYECTKKVYEREGTRGGI